MPSDSFFDSEAHLCYSDITVDNSARPQVIKIIIKQSKTDPCRKGVDLFLGKTSADLCPVESLFTYLVIRGTKGGLLFIFKDGHLLTRHCFMIALRGAVQAAGVDTVVTVLE